MRAFLLIAALLLAGCQSAGHVAEPAPQVIETTRTVYVPIPKKLTVRCPIARGQLDEVVIVSRKRKASLEVCNTQLDTIEKIQGTPAPVEP